MIGLNQLKTTQEPWNLTSKTSTSIHLKSKTFMQEQWTFESQSNNSTYKFLISQNPSSIQMNAILVNPQSVYLQNLPDTFNWTCACIVMRWGHEYNFCRMTLKEEFFLCKKRAPTKQKLRKKIKYTQHEAFYTKKAFVYTHNMKV